MPTYYLGHDSDALAQGSLPGQGRVLVRYSQCLGLASKVYPLFARVTQWPLPASPGHGSCTRPGTVVILFTLCWASGGCSVLTSKWKGKRGCWEKRGTAHREPPPHAWSCQDVVGKKDGAGGADGERDKVGSPKGQGGVGRPCGWGGGSQPHRLLDLHSLLEMKSPSAGIKWAKSQLCALASTGGDSGPLWLPWREVCVELMGSGK